MQKSMFVVCLIVVCYAVGAVAGGRGEDPGEHRGILRHDDLRWLMGSWRCVARAQQSGVPSVGGSHDESRLQWFNVYYPFADDALSIELTLNPDDRPIAAEFLVTMDPNSQFYRDGYFPMTPYSVVRIGTNVIRLGSTFDTFDFHYRYYEIRGIPILLLESRHMILTLIKVSEDAGNIESSWAKSDVRTYATQKREELLKRYWRLSPPPPQ
jgi:hypothetical protein